MSNALYPSLPGLAYPVERTASWGTRMQRAVSGRTLRLRDYVNPIWSWTLVYSALEDQPAVAAGPQSVTSAPNALRTILDFFNSRGGAADDFLFQDPHDNSALAQLLVAVPGDTTATLFQLTRQLVAGGFNEWIIAPNTVSTVYFNGTPQSPASWTLLPGGVIQFAAPLGGGITPTADFTYYFRVYFTDRMSPSYFVQQLAELKQVKLTSEVL